MLWRTHFLASAAAGLLLAGHTDAKTAALSAGVAGIAALLPDVDSPDSKIGRMIPVIPRLFKTVVGHRGALHSAIGVAAVFILAALFLGWRAHIPKMHYLILAGYLSHLVMDSFNPQGVPWLWPYGKRFGLPLVQTGSLLERFVVMPGMVLLVAWFGITKLWLWFPTIKAVFSKILKGGIL
ncbi:MAG: Inner membrane protein YdjM [Pelotomaculum sp. PtaB.Bin104]|nr:MAG: Inner membrane protein YdjM [Pelotomaculum sp. PtaB.Bin104]